MFEFLADQMWQFIIGALIAIVTIIVSIIIYLKQRSRKRLSYEILSNTALLSVEEEIKNDIQLTYKGKVVEGVKLLVLRIFNSGNLPIVSADYERPIGIEFGKETRVLAAEVIEKNPANLQSTISIENRVVTLYPALLNPSDSVTIKMLVTKYENDFQVNSRIIGVSRIELLPESSVMTSAVIFTFILLGVWAFGSVIWSFIFHVSFFEAFAYFSIVFYILFVIAMFAILADKRSRKILEKQYGDFIKDRGSKREEDNSE